MKPIAYFIPAALLLMSACAPGIEAPTDSGTEMVDHAGHNSDPAGSAEMNDAQAAYKAVNDRMHAGMADIPADADIAFMQGMLAHHRGAVEMSEVELQYGEDAAARDLAQRVIAAQEAEIAEMEAWLAERGAP